MVLEIRNSHPHRTQVYVYKYGNEIITPLQRFNSTSERSMHPPSPRVLLLQLFFGTHTATIRQKRRLNTHEQGAGVIALTER